MRHQGLAGNWGARPRTAFPMFRNQVTSLLDKERIRTTLPRAKELRPIAEKMITLGKRESLHARRQALAFIKDPGVVAKLVRDHRPALLPAQWRLHPHHQGRLPGRRRRTDGHPRDARQRVQTEQGWRRREKGKGKEGAAEAAKEEKGKGKEKAEAE